jgi:hypothetical protein
VWLRVFVADIEILLTKEGFNMKRILALSLILFSLPAMADITASYDVNSKQNMEISYKDDKHLRLNMGADSYALYVDGKVYMVTKAGGSWMATDLAELKQMMSNMPFGQKQKPAPSSEKDYKMVKTGRTETVAGYEGNVYEFTDLRNNEKYEAVLSDHDDIATLYKGLMKISREIANSAGVGDQIPEMPAVKGGLLRQGKNLRLTSVDKQDKGLAYYQLPAGVQMQTFAMPEGMPKGMTMPDAESLQKMMEGMKGR